MSPENDAPKEAKVLSKPFHLKDLVAEVDRLMAA
jgi:two-component system cell cycle response regulator CpdR